MSDQNPAETLRNEINSLERSIDDLRKRVTLSSIRDEVANLHNSTLGLPQRIQDLRRRNYAFDKSLETKAGDMGMRWATIKGSVEGQLMAQSTMLQNDMRSLDAKLPQLATYSSNQSVAQAMLPALKTETEALDRRCSAAEDAIENIYRPYQQEYSSLDQSLDTITWSLDQLDEATFQLLADESLVLAVKATWTRDGKEDGQDPKGTLFLSDQRIFFEQKQEVATKKILFITTATEKVHKLLYFFAVGQVEDVLASKQGLFKNQDYIDIRCVVDAPYPSIVLHLDGQDSTAWATLIKRVRMHDLDADRALAVNQEAVEKVRSAPTKCASCGGTITQPILRGQDTLQCEFCGAVIRL
jgi:hypothetical protein